MQIALALLNLLSLVSGFVGTILLAQSIGLPRGARVPPEGILAVALVMPKRGRIGIWMISAAFFCQLPAAIFALHHALNSRN